MNIHGPMLTCAVVWGVSLLAVDARADCSTPEPALVWSYPGMDQVVPPDAPHWILVSTWGTPEVRVEGAGASSMTGFREYEPPELQPETTYDLVVTLSDAEAAPVDFRVSFSTSAAEPPSEAPARPIINGHSLSEMAPDWTPTCRAVFNAVDCYDTGQDTYVSLAVDQTPLLWLVRTGSDAELQGRQFLWPGECGPPVHFTHGWWEANGSTGPRLCYELIAVDGFGQRSAPATYCTWQDPPAEADDEPALFSCGSTGARPSALFVLLVFLGMRRRIRLSLPEREQRAAAMPARAVVPNL